MSLEEEASSSWSGPGNHICGHAKQHCLSGWPQGSVFSQSWELTTLTA